jgi:glutathione S-transferase
MIPYTIPTVRLLSNTYVMDSRAIATALESAHPSPSLHLDSAALTAVEELMPKILLSLRGIWMPPIPSRLLNEGSVETFERVRKERLGMSLKELEQKEGGEQAWENAREGIKALGDILKKDESGPFVLGKTREYLLFLFGTFCPV